MKELIKYDAARAALEACVSVDEVKGWSDHAAACEAYARQAKDKDMRKMAIDIRMRAKRRLGELMAEQNATVGKNKGGRPKKTGIRPTPVSLAEVGIDKRLARESRAAAAMDSDAFEAAVELKKAAVDEPDFRHIDYDPSSELAEGAAEALAIVASDDMLATALKDLLAAQRETKAMAALYDALKAEVYAHKREIKKWMAKAKKSALCEACKVNLERDE